MTLQYVSTLGKGSAVEMVEDLVAETPQAQIPVSKTSYALKKGVVSRTVTVGNRTTVSKLNYTPPGETKSNPEAAWDWAYLRSDSPPRADLKGRAIRCADLFSGCGGLSLGVAEACLATGKTFVPAFAADWDAAALDVYKANFLPLESYGENIEELIDGDLGGKITIQERMLRNRIKGIDILVAGPPCQGHSNLNNHTRRKDDRNQLYERVGRFAEIFEPEHVIIENVSTVIHSMEKSVDRVMERLGNIGYSVDDGIIDSSLLGVPQRRRRHILIMSKRGTRKVENIAVGANSGNLRTVRWAFEDLEGIQAKETFDTSANISEDNRARIRYLMENDLYDLPNELRPSCHKDKKHSYSAMYGRLRYDEPAPTLTTGFHSPGQGRYVHPTQPRTITPHEAARLQFFPDFFDFSQARNRQNLARLIGNAVPMKLGYVFAFDLLAS